VRNIIALTGCSGIIYGARLLETLRGEKILIVSHTAERILGEETEIRIEDLRAKADQVYDDLDLFAPIASGSYPFDGMVIIPCSASTLGKMANGIADTLITRVAAVCMKERRRLILVPRETPLSDIMIENQLKMTRSGAIVLPACPGFYHRPKNVEEMIDFVVGRVLDQMGEEHDLYRRWG